MSMTTMWNVMCLRSAPFPPLQNVHGKPSGTWPRNGGLQPVRTRPDGMSYFELMYNCIATEKQETTKWHPASTSSTVSQTA